MINSQPSDVKPWLIIDASHEGTMRFATALPSPRPSIGNVRTIDIRGCPTFTDALQQYERESGIPLRGLECAMAMAGATSGETLSIVRSRWTITRSGLAAIFGKPVTILNDVVARAWASRSGTATIDVVHGVSAPNFSRPGRYLMILVEEGVGAAAVDVDRDSSIRVLETEAGHIDFAPSSEREEKLAAAVRGAARYVSWEQMLTLDRNDPVWSAACPEMLEPERPRLLAELLGRFTINLMLGFGAWQGVMLTGSRAGRILEGPGRASFDAEFRSRRNFSRLISSTPACRVDQHEAVLTGAAERLAQNSRPS